MNIEQYVISLNDYPEEVCSPGTTFEQSRKRCIELRHSYIKAHPGINKAVVYFHARSVRVWPNHGAHQ